MQKRKWKFIVSKAMRSSYYKSQAFWLEQDFNSINRMGEAWCPRFQDLEECLIADVLEWFLERRCCRLLTCKIKAPSPIDCLDLFCGFFFTLLDEDRRTSLILFGYLSEPPRVLFTTQTAGSSQSVSSHSSTEPPPFHTHPCISNWLQHCCRCVALTLRTPRARKGKCWKNTQELEFLKLKNCLVVATSMLN